MKKFYFIAILIIAFSCQPQKRVIGRLSVASTKNVSDFHKIKKIGTFEATNKDLRKARAKSLESAIDNTLSIYKEAVLITNAKFSIVNSQYYIVEGDIFGTVSNEYNGFKIGEKITFKHHGKFVLGEIVDLKKDNLLIKIEEKIIEVKYEDLR